MKGIIFVELLHFMDEQLGEAGTEHVIDRAALSHDAAFTGVGNYPSQDAETLVAAASELTGIEAGALCEAFGRFLFLQFEKKYPHLLRHYHCGRDLLDHVGSHIHEEVKAIHPDATPPEVTTEECEKGYRVIYRSHRHFAHIAYGLIQQCLAFYDEDSQVEWEPGSTPQHASFVIRPLIVEESA